MRDLEQKDNLIDMILAGKEKFSKNCGHDFKIMNYSDLEVDPFFVWKSRLELTRLL